MPQPEHPYLSDSYSYITKNDIVFRINKNTFTKVYGTKSSMLSSEQLKQRFVNEITAYQYFNKINWSWSPKLISYSAPDRGFTLERLRHETIHERLHWNKSLGLNKLINTLKQLEKDLISNKINCRNITNKDILLGNEKIWLVDFEETTINEKYSQSLFVQLAYDLSRRWDSYYLESAQKHEYRKKLRAVIIKQLFSFEFIHLKGILNSFYFTSKYRIGFKLRELKRKF